MSKMPDFSRPYNQVWAKQSANLFAGDLVGSLLELGMVSQMTNWEQRFPTLTNTIVDTMTPTVRYFQDPIEWVVNHGKTFEGAELQKKRQSKPKEERAHDISHAILHYGIPVAVSYGSAIATEKMMAGYVTRSPGLAHKFWLADFGVHVGLVTLMGTPLLAPVTEKAKDAVNVVSKVFGANEEQAEDIARLSVLSVLPNYTTFGIVTKAIHNNLKATAEKLDIISSRPKIH